MIKCVLIYGALLATVVNVKTVNAAYKFTNMKCTSLNKTFMEFYNCKITPLDRKNVAISAAAHLYDLPVENTQIRIRFMRKSNGYKPFIYDVVIDGCKFLKNSLKSTRIHPLVDFLYQRLSNHSNINHTCPYNHDIIIDKLTIKEASELQLSGFLNGEFAIFTTWSSNSKQVAEFDVYFSVS